MISKELLSEVLGHKISKGYDEVGIVRVVGVDESDLIFRFQHIESSIEKYINIHELAFLIRDYLKEKYEYTLDMSLDVKQIFTNATQFHESML